MYDDESAEHVLTEAVFDVADVLDWKLKEGQSLREAIIICAREEMFTEENPENPENQEITIKVFGDEIRCRLHTDWDK